MDILLEDAYAAEDVIRELADACRQQTSRRQTPPPEEDPCYELFCRALDHPPDNAAWDALMTQYGRWVWSKLGLYADDDACQEVLIRFWKALHDSDTPLRTRFPNTAAILGYLKKCVFTVRTEMKRETECRIQLEEMLRGAALADLVLLRARPDAADAESAFQQAIADHLKTPQEQVLFDLRYRYGLSPQEIHTQRPDLFPGVATVYRVQENLAKRLRRDAILMRRWGGEETSQDGGNSPTSSV